jgi:hypothetical protein
LPRLATDWYQIKDNNVKKKVSSRFFFLERSGKL